MSSYKRRFSPAGKGRSNDRTGVHGTEDISALDFHVTAQPADDFRDIDSWYRPGMAEKFVTHAERLDFVMRDREAETDILKLFEEEEKRRCRLKTIY